MSLRKSKLLSDPKISNNASIESPLVESSCSLPEGLLVSKKQASSQAAWALLTGGVSEARTEVHRLRHLTNRAQKVIDNHPPETRDKIYQVAGDVIVGVPERLAKIEQTLDKVSYALSCMGQDFLKSRLPLDDRTEVDEAVKHVLKYGTISLFISGYLLNFFFDDLISISRVCIQFRTRIFSV